jgi:hypothetical protein
MRYLLKHHPYEELRGVVIDILLGRETVKHGVGQYDNLVNGVAEVLERRGSPTRDAPMTGSPEDIRLESLDVELIRDVFWDLFRQGFITLGIDDNKPMWPWFRLSHHGKETLGGANPWRFHDANSYLLLVKQEAPDITAEAITYLEEAMATFYSSCLLAACIMLGVAAEIEFLRLIDVGAAHASHSEIFIKAKKERGLRQKVVSFQKGLHKLPKDILDRVGEDLDTHFHAIQSVLRVARNEMGHAAAGKVPTREQVYVFLQLFVPFAGQLARFREAMK